MAGLYDEPVGMLDPRSMALMQMGLGLMGQGPSQTPISLGQSLGQAGMQGLQAFQQARNAQIQEAFRQAQMRKMDEELALRRQELARKENSPIVAAPGSQFLRPGTGEVIHTVPFKPEPTPEAKPPTTRRVRVGTDDVTQEFRDGQWHEVGRGPAFQKLVQPAGGAPALPKPPTGYRYKQGTDELEPIPGGPKDTSGKDLARREGAIQQAKLVMGKVDEALDKVGFSSTGLTGAVLGAVPGTKAYDLDKTVDTIKANLGFDKLQAMREASPTGGALGQVAVQELSMLQSVVASLDKGQSEDQIRNNLAQIKKHYSNWLNAVMQDKGGEGAPAQSQDSPQQPELTAMPPAAKHKGKVIENSKGKRFKSDGMSWRPL